MELITSAGADLSFVHLGITIEHLRNSISIFGFRIAFYGMIIGCGMLAGMAVAFSDAKGGDRIRIFIWILRCMGSYFLLSAPDSTM